ncbi:MAG: hypothetical protein WBO35_06800 [Candidatus Saccharimonadales bacterium]|jgi:hypothetical protein
MWKFSSHQQSRVDAYWARVADQEFDAMDKEGQSQWSELRR